MRPETVKVGQLAYRILVDPDAIRAASDGAEIANDTEWAAFSNHDTLVIGINASNPGGVQRRDVLHELLHCCLRLSGVEPNVYARIVGRAKGKHDGYTVEEFVVAAMSGPLLGVLADNPQLVMWLSEDPNETSVQSG